MKKRTLTLLEIMIGMVILGIIMTSFFQMLRQNVKLQIHSKELKQTALQQELFVQKLKSLFSACETSWISKHEQASGKVLCVQYEQTEDPDFAFCGTIEAMLYLNPSGQLCLAHWTEKKEGRMEVLLDKVTQFECALFDIKSGSWCKDTKEPPKEAGMVQLNIAWNQQILPFVFFLAPSYKPIKYSL